MPLNLSILSLRCSDLSPPLLRQFHSPPPYRGGHAQLRRVKRGWRGWVWQSVQSSKLRGPRVGGQAIQVRGERSQNGVRSGGKKYVFIFVYFL